MTFRLLKLSRQKNSALGEGVFEMKFRAMEVYQVRLGLTVGLQGETQDEKLVTQIGQGAG